MCPFHYFVYEFACDRDIRHNKFTDAKIDSLEIITQRLLCLGKINSHFVFQTFPRNQVEYRQAVNTNSKIFKMKMDTHL